MIVLEFDGFDIKRYGLDKYLNNHKYSKSDIKIIVSSFENNLFECNLGRLLGEELKSVELLMDGTIIFKYVERTEDIEVWLSFHIDDKEKIKEYDGLVKNIYDTKMKMIDSIIGKNGLINTFYNFKTEKKEETKENE